MSYKKCFLIYVSDFENNSIHLCKSANALVPRQFEGFSCVTIKSSHTVET